MKKKSKVEADIFYDKEKSQTILQLKKKLTFFFKEWKFEVPEGFCSDGASTPRFMWWKCPKIDGRYIFWFIVHDYFYFEGLVNRKIADQILLEGLLEDGMRKSLAYEIYFGVRIFGKSHWMTK